MQILKEFHIIKKVGRSKTNVSLSTAIKNQNYSDTGEVAAGVFLVSFLDAAQAQNLEIAAPATASTVVCTISFLGAVIFFSLKKELTASATVASLLLSFLQWKLGTLWR